MHPAPRKRWALAVAVFIGAAACSSGGSSKDSGDKSAIGKAKAAVIQIDVTGTFANVEGGTDENQEGRGSGFVISKDGLAVTNNHVVTGATKISVRVPGKTDPVPAKVLGASECADLAVIDLEGGGYDALEWAKQAPDIGDEVQAVGYPLGVREITLKPGVVEKVKGPEATDWAAVAGVMQHSAEIKPGNSGGPLVNKSGQVVGVNYAGSEKKKEYHSITSETARPLVERLSKGENVDSLGINAQAIALEDEEAGGVFVASTITGSAPDKLGVRPGDVLLRLEEQPLANDGTMADYCGVIRSRDTAKPLRLGLVRLEGEDIAFYTGTLNEADSKLKSLDLGGGDEADGAAPAAPAVDFEAALNALPDGTEVAEFDDLLDDTGSLLIRAPKNWGAVEKAPANPLTGGGRPLPHIGASADAGAFHAVTGPGTSFYAFPNSAGTVKPDTLLESFSGVEGCTLAATEPVPNDLFDMYAQYWVGCKGTPTIFVRSTATPIGRKEIIAAETVVTTKAELIALLQSLLTFEFDGAAFEKWKAEHPT
jgi:serine protease Do